MTGKVALVTGANGITGSAIAEHLCKNTTAEEWSKIIITSRSPLTLHFSDPRMEFIPLDFSKPLKDPKFESLCKDVTHAFFSSYVHRDDFAELNKANSQLFEHFLDGLTSVAKNLENVVLQTGGKHYYVHLFPVPTPAREEDPRMPATLDNFYFPQEDALIKAAKERNFRWNVIRPEAIIGVTSKPNGMNEALTIAMYFLVQAKLGKEAIMPTNQRFWEGIDDFSSSKLIASLSTYVAENEKCGNEAFNVTNGDHVSWRHFWPRLASYFGAQASSQYKFTKPYPKEGEVQLEVSLSEWAKDKQQIWDALCEEHGVPEAKATWTFGTWGFQDWVFQRTWCCTLSVNKARKFGWTESVDSYDNFIETFQAFEKQKLIPAVKH